MGVDLLHEHVLVNGAHHFARLRVDVYKRQGDTVPANALLEFRQGDKRERR